MAVDNRPFKSKEQDGQGNEVIIRDQQLVEQASQTTMASGEYFEIVDVDGRMAKIPKANMVDIVREALGTLLNGLSDQTTVTKVPSLNGNTLGASTVATLASVLGVVVEGNTKPLYFGTAVTNNYYITIKVNNLARGGIVYISTPAGGYIGGFNDKGATGGISSLSIDTSNNSIKIQRAETRIAISFAMVISPSLIINITGSDT